MKITILFLLKQKQKQQFLKNCCFTQSFEFFLCELLILLTSCFVKSSSCEHHQVRMNFFLYNRSLHLLKITTF